MVISKIFAKQFGISSFSNPWSSKQEEEFLLCGSRSKRLQKFVDESVHNLGYNLINSNFSSKQNLQSKKGQLLQIIQADHQILNKKRKKPFHYLKQLFPRILIDLCFILLQQNTLQLLSLIFKKGRLNFRKKCNLHNFIYRCDFYIQIITYSVMPQMLQKVGKNFKIIRKIDEGAFGEIFQAINTKTNLQVAVKVQPINTEHPQLIYECKLYNYLHNDSTVIDKGIPNVYYCSTEGDFNVLVMDLMGKSLESLFSQTLRKFSLKTVLILIDQMISRIEYIHNRHFIHRDIKPDNFCIGLNKTSNKIFILDFGLAKRYIQRDGKHIPYREGKNLTGTARYASINTHLGIEQACRDDMESIGYVVMYFLRGMLPWQGLKANNKRDKYERIKEKKLTTSIQVLCKGYPVEFTKYLSQCRNLRFDERPQYTVMRNMFKDLFQRNGYKYDYQYDWVILSEKKEKMQKKEEGKSKEDVKEV